MIRPATGTGSQFLVYLLVGFNHSVQCSVEFSKCIREKYSDFHDVVTLDGVTRCGPHPQHPLVTPVCDIVIAKIERCISFWPADSEDFG